MRQHHHVLLIGWIIALEGMSCQLDGGDTKNDFDIISHSTPSTNGTVDLISPSMESFPANYVRVFPHNSITAINATPILNEVVPVENESKHLYTVEPSLISSTMNTAIATLEGNYPEQKLEGTVQTEPNNQRLHMFRNNLPLQLDSEEIMDNTNEPLFPKTTQVTVSSNIPLTSLDEIEESSIPLSNEDSSAFRDTFVNNSAKNLATTISITDNASDADTILGDDSFSLTNIRSSVEITATSIYSQHTTNTPVDTVTEVKQMDPTTPPVDVITVFASSPLQVHDNWTQFYMILRGNCHFIDLKNSQALFYDFIKSFSALLLYNREHIVVDSLTCSGRKMTLNMSIDSIYYPNCEKDLRTLLSHRNIRVNLHNTSFYIHSYETKRTLIFETKQDDEEPNSYILYMTLGGVGIALICIIFAGIVFTIYQCCVAKRTKKQHADLRNDRFLAESPRSFQPKFEIDQSLRFSDQRTYKVNMYKSYSDLTAPDLYGHLGSPNHPEPGKETVFKNTTILTRIPKEKKKKKKKKKTDYNSYGLNDCEAYQEFWSESIAQTNEDFVTIQNVNTMTSSFKTNVKETEKDSLSPLLKQGIPVSTILSKTQQDLPFPPPPPPPTTCPPSPAISRGVLERMDQLIANTFSNSSPDINTCNAYASTYSNTTINISSASSAMLANAPSSTAIINKDSPPKGFTNSSSSSTDRTRVPSSTSASAENLCLTRITFMEMCVWPQHSSSQLTLDGQQSNGRRTPSAVSSEEAGTRYLTVRTPP